MVISPAVGGIVIGYEIARQLGVENIFAERVDRKMTLRRGFSISAGTNVLVVEDVITTGKSAIECSDLIKKNKANLVGYACLIDRSNDNLLIKEKVISQVKLSIETFEKNNLPEDLKNISPYKPGSKDLSK